MKDRTTSDNITSLKEKEIFVFGSNLAGRHGSGAARTALQWGAKWDRGIGISKRTYAIPTKDKEVKRTLPLEEIKRHVDKFIDHAKFNYEYTYLVTEIGCGLAGLTPKEVAPLFREAINVPNIHLPERFWIVLNNQI